MLNVRGIWQGGVQVQKQIHGGGGVILIIGSQYHMSNLVSQKETPLIGSEFISHLKPICAFKALFCHAIF